MQVKKLSGRQINRNLVLALLGTDGKQLQDSYYICENVKELLKLIMILKEQCIYVKFPIKL